MDKHHPCSPLAFLCCLSLTEAPGLAAPPCFLAHQSGYCSPAATTPARGAFCILLLLPYPLLSLDCHSLLPLLSHWSRSPVTSLLPCEGAFGCPLTWPFGSRAPDHSSLYGLETAPSPRLSCRPRCSSQPALPAPVLSLSLCGCSWGSALNSFPCFPSLKGPPAAGSLAPQIPSSSTWIPEWNGFPRLMCTSLDRP